MSSTSRTARSGTSSGYFLGAAMTPTIRWLGASIKPGAIQPGILEVALADRLRDAAELVLQVGGRGGLGCAAVFRRDDGQPQGVQPAGRGDRRVMTDAPARCRVAPAHRPGRRRASGGWPAAGPAPGGPPGRGAPAR